MSTEQGENHSTTDQLNVVKGDEVSNEQSQSSKDWWSDADVISKEEYKKLQKEYTKSRQELSDLKKNSELSDEDKAAIDFIKKNWFVTKDDLDNMSKRQAQEVRLKDIITANPDLQPFESAIRELWQKWDIAYEDIIQKYGFKSGDKLKKAKKQGDIKWMPETKEKPIAEMSIEEYEKYKAKQWRWSNRWSFS